MSTQPPEIITEIITETTTLAELRAHLMLLGVSTLRVYGCRHGCCPRDLVEASAHHATGFYRGTGPTEAVAIEVAFSKLRRALTPQEIEEKVP
jgi:hypothetical protein